ncbi:hypothetical protein ACPA9J_33265 [Pseudomonas aeruginosa]
MRKNLGKWPLVWPPQAYLLFFLPGSGADHAVRLVPLSRRLRRPGALMYSEDGQTVYDLSVEN